MTEPSAPESIQAELRDRLHEAWGPGPQATGDWPDLQRRLGPARRRRHRRRAAVAAALVIVLGAAVALIGTDGGSERVRTVPAGPTPGTATAPSTLASPTTSIGPLDRLRVRTLAQATVAGAGVLAAGTDGSVWAAVVDQGQVVHVSPTGRQLGRITLPPTAGTPGSGLAQDTPKGYPIWLASGEGSVWALSWGSGALYRIDPATDRVTGSVAITTKLDAGTTDGRAEVEGMAPGLGSVWVTVCCDAAVPNQRLLRIDPATLAIAPVTAALPGDGENETVVAGTPGLFVTGEGFDTVAQVDPTTMRVIRQIPVTGGAGPVTLAGIAYVVGGWSTGTSSGAATYTIDGNGPTTVLYLVWPAPIQQVVAVDGATLWARTPGGQLFRHANDRLQVVPGVDGVAGMAVAPDGSVWIGQGDRLSRIGPADG